MNLSSLRSSLNAERLAWVLPLLMLAANVLAWLRYGSDFPMVDDWRYYARGDIDQFSLARLFRAENNTLAPVGLALDTLAQRVLDGNGMGYQLLSMLAVLGSLLWLQWRLLRWAIDDTHVRAAALVFTVLMFQSGSFWGEQNLAYHQALPLVFLLAALAVVLTSGLGAWGRAGLAALCGLLMGMSYISGAVVALVAGAVLGLLWRLDRSSPDQPAVRAGAIGLMLAGGATLLPQWVLTRLTKVDDPARDIPVTWPYQGDYWVFLLGKIGRALGRPFDSVALEVTLSIGLSLLVLGVAAAALLWLRRPPGERNSDALTHAKSLCRMAWVYLPLCAAVLAYLALVAFGRAGLHDMPVHDWQDVLRLGHKRFHYYWVCLLVPWLAAAMLLRVGARRMGVAASLLCLVGLGLFGARGVFDINRHYRESAAMRAAEIRCMLSQLGSGQPIACPTFFIPDLTPALAHARQIGASFIRYFPIVEHEPPAHWLLDWPQVPAQGQMQWHHLAPLDGARFEAGNDPQLVFTSSQPQAFARCLSLEVQVRLRPEKTTHVQVFVQPQGRADFNEADSRSKPVVGGQWNERHFVFDSLNGFAPVLRIDPVQDHGYLEWTALRATCRLSALSTDAPAEGHSHYLPETKPPETHDAILR